MQIVLTWLLAAIKTSMAQKLIIALAESLVKRTDNTFDDKALEIVKEVIEKTSA